MQQLDMDFSQIPNHLVVKPQAEKSSTRQDSGQFDIQQKLRMTSEFVLNMMLENIRIYSTEQKILHRKSVVLSVTSWLSDVGNYDDIYSLDSICLLLNLNSKAIRKGLLEALDIFQVKYEILCDDQSKYEPILFEIKACIAIIKAL